MSATTLRLTTLLRVRRIQEEIKRGRLAAEVASERRAQVVLGQAHERYVAWAAEQLVAPETVRVFMAQRRSSGALAGSVCVAGAGVNAAAEVTYVARRDWSEAAMRMAALERLEDRAREAATAKRLAAEQRTSEESSAVQHQRSLADSDQGARS